MFCILAFDFKLMQEAILLNETNWNDVFRGMQQFPFRASEIKSVNKELALSNISFKFNIRGKEVYDNYKQTQVLLGGDYLLITNQDRCEIQIQEEQNDIGICIDVNQDLLKQALQLHFHPNEMEDVHEADYYWFQADLFVRYRASTAFNDYMAHLFPAIRDKTFPSLQCLEMDFIAHFLQEQLPHFKAYQFVPLMKRQSKKELYQRLIQARNSMQDMVYQQVSIQQLARELCMSEFRFHHMYKEVFGVSPHRDMIRFKCEEALRLFHQLKLTWTEIALRLDFADLPTFSKAFKRITGVTPSKYSLTRV
ncbi:MAG: helix-turn-helix transcriptional regulator [Chitinophagaceae bacterium]|nr:helix-turn-helix transcriptional regulator [Chitinophagaceae bacterium]